MRDSESIGSKALPFLESDHTFAVCAYKSSPYLRECLESVTHQTTETNVIIATSTPTASIRTLADEYKVPCLCVTGSQVLRMTGIMPLPVPGRLLSLLLIRMIHTRLLCRGGPCCFEFSQSSAHLLYELRRIASGGSLLTIIGFSESSGSFYLR